MIRPIDGLKAIVKSALGIASIFTVLGLLYWGDNSLYSLMFDQSIVIIFTSAWLFVASTYLLGDVVVRLAKFISTLRINSGPF